MPPERPRVAAERVPELDLLRFIAAMLVSLYHLTYRPLQDGVASDTVFESFQLLSRYGYLGVYLFFMISGFVIMWSAVQRSSVSFLVSRLSRLYPTFWTCMFITLLFLWSMSRLKPSATAWNVLMNMSMLASPLAIPMVDGVYWTLFIELKFYALVFLISLLFHSKSYQTLVYFWLAGAFALSIMTGLMGLHHPALSAVGSLLIMPWAPLFIGGALFYFVWLEGPSVARAAALAICLILSMQLAAKTEVLFTSGLSPLTSATTLVVIAVYFASFAAISLRLWRLPTLSLWTLLGSLTYPVYLLHNEISKAFWAFLPQTWTPLTRLTIIVLIVTALSWVVAALVERRLAPDINKALQKAIQNLGLEDERRRPSGV